MNQVANHQYGFWAERIRDSYGLVVKNVLETGQLLIEAKAALDHGTFEAMISTDLPFSASTARRFMIIGKCDRFQDRAHAHELPSSWATLYELTKLDDETYSQYLADGTISPDLERATVTQKIKADRRAERESELAEKIRALPDKKYGVIYADPEWRFEPRSRETGMDRAADNHYPTSTTEEIASRDVASIAAKDCVLFLWGTVPMRPQAHQVIESWGFKYSSEFVWIKQRSGNARGTGYWNTNEHETLLVATKGKVPAPTPGTQWGSVQYAPVGKKHSEKPDKFAEMIEEYYPNLPKIELNARRPRPGWDQWGNEVE